MAVEVLVELVEVEVKVSEEQWVTQWRNSYGVGLAIKQSWVRFLAGPLSSCLGLLSLPSFRGR